jgi:hypothetical protein
MNPGGKEVKTMAAGKRFEYCAGFVPCALPTTLHEKARMAEVEDSLNKLEPAGWWIVSVMRDEIRDGYVIVSKRELR